MTLTIWAETQNETERPLTVPLDRADNAVAMKTPSVLLRICRLNARSSGRSAESSAASREMICGGRAVGLVRNLLAELRIYWPYSRSAGSTPDFLAALQISWLKVERARRRPEIRWSGAESADWTLKSDGGASQFAGGTVKFAGSTPGFLAGLQICWPRSKFGGGAGTGRFRPPPADFAPGPRDPECGQEISAGAGRFPLRPALTRTRYRSFSSSTPSSPSAFRRTAFLQEAL